MRRQLIIGPTEEQLRPVKSKSGAPARGGFPIYPNLERILLADEPWVTPEGDEFLPMEVARYVSAVLSTWCYADIDTVAIMMARLGLFECRCRFLEIANNAMLIRSTACLIQSKSGAVALLAYRGTDPFDLSTWAVSGDVNPTMVAFDKKAQGMQLKAEPEPPPNPPRPASYPFLRDLTTLRGSVRVLSDRLLGLPRRVLRGGSREDRSGSSDPLVHGGFYRNQRATWFDIAGALDNAVRGNSIFYAHELRESSELRERHEALGPCGKLQRLYVTGHSLGGAMALIAAFKIATDEAYRSIDRTIKHVYTFGQPMAGNVHFAKMCDRYLENRVSSHVFKSDVVPHLPPAFQDQGPEFAHVGAFYEAHPADPSTPAHACNWRLSARAPEPAESVGQLLLAFDAAFGDRMTISASLLSILSAAHERSGKMLMKLLGLLVEKRKYSLYDHVPTHSVACSQLPGKKNHTEFGDDF